MRFFDDIHNRRILVSPLDWGLGHAARMVNVIRCLMSSNDVTIVCGGSALQFLRRELPDACIIEIDDWKIRYPKGRIGFFTILGWVPVMLRNIINEHRFAKRIIKEKNIDLVLSDNRYGLLFRGMECMIVTHQVYPKMPRGFGWLENLNGWLFKKYLSFFDKVLIPDFAEGESLSGMLSADRVLDPQKFLRVGILSRFGAGEREMSAPKEIKYDFMVLISGQENQRTVFEELLIDAFDGCGRCVLMVRGVGEERELPRAAQNIEYRNMLSGKALEDALMASRVVICRAGYSTLCDVVALGKRAIIVPTPGQTEQEYLSDRLDGRFGFRGLRQECVAERIRSIGFEIMGEGVPDYE